MLPMISPEIVTVGAAVLALLLSGNIFFIKKLVDRVEKTAGLDTSMTLLSTQLREIKQDIKDLRRIEIDVAVLRSQINQTQSPQGA